MSKFRGLMDAANSRENPTAQPAPVVMSSKQSGRGRPRGKRSDPDFEQITAYIRKETHHGVKIALLQEGQRPASSVSWWRIYLPRWLQIRS